MTPKHHNKVVIPIKQSIIFILFHKNVLITNIPRDLHITHLKILFPCVYVGCAWELS